MSGAAQFEIEEESDGRTLRLSGPYLVSTIGGIDQDLGSVAGPLARIDLSQVTEIDTVGAYVARSLAARHGGEVTGASERAERLMGAVSQDSAEASVLRKERGSGIELPPFPVDGPRGHDVSVANPERLDQIDGEAPEQDDPDLAKEVGDDSAWAVECCPDKLRTHCPGCVAERAVGNPGGGIELAAFNRAWKDPQPIVGVTRGPTDKAGRVGMVLEPLITLSRAPRLRGADARRDL